MAKLTIKQLQTIAVEVVRARREGIRYLELVDAIVKRETDTPVNTIKGAVSKLAVDCSDEIIKPARGLFKASEGRSSEVAPEPSEQTDTPQKQKFREDEFYKPFAEWLQDVLDECTIAVPLGGKVQNQKWGTPDVLGVYKPLTRDLLKFTPEFVTAEIKIEPGQTVTAFGQAIAYRLFAAKTYLVIPKSVDLEDLSRIEAMCMLCGVGLVLFSLDPQKPDFEIRIRAQRFSPDMFFANEFVERLKDHDKGVFDELFG